MDWLLPALFIALIGSLVLVFTYLNLYLQERQGYLALWLASWSLYAIRFVFEVLAILWRNQAILLIMNQLSLLWSAAFLLWGTCLFSGKKLNGAWLALFAAGSIWIVASSSFHLSSPWTTVPIYLAPAFTNIFTGVVLLRFRETAKPAKVTTGWAFILWGLHKANYPLLRPLAWAAPFGYVFGAVFGFISNIGIILVYLEKTRMELKESEEKYRSIFENAVEGIFQTTPEGRILSANPSLARVYGYESPEQLVKSWVDLATEVYVNQDDRKRLQTLLREHGFVKQFETTMYRINGDIRWVSMNVRAVRDESGEIRFYEGSLEDITERKQVEEYLRTSRLQLSDAADLARIAYWEYDEASKEYIFNDAFYALYATTADREGGYLMARGEYLKRFVHPDDAEGLAREIEESRAHPYTDDLQEYEHRAIRGDGEVIHILARKRVLADPEGRVVGAMGVNQDITKGKKTEEQLTIANSALQSSISAVVFADPEGRITYVNDSFVELWGYDRAEEVLGRHISEFAMLSVEEDIKATRQGHGYIGEARARKKDGSLFYVQTAANIVKMGKGQPASCLMASFVDITERKMAEETLRRYELLSGSSRDIILFMGREGDILEANVAAERAYGYSREELLGLNVRDLRAPETRDLTAVQVAEADERGILFESTHRRRDGSTFPVEVSSQGANINGNRTLISVVRDISERKLAEMVLKESEESLRVFLDAVPHPAFLMDRDGTATVTNSALARSLGISNKDIKGKKIFDLIGPGIAEQRKAYAARIVETGKAVIFEDSRAGRDFVNHMYPVLDYAGAVSRIAVFALDVTEAKSLQAQLIHAQKMEAIGTLAGGVAHDFNNILTVIMGLGNLIQISLDPGDRNRPYIDQIVLASERAADLTQSLLAYSRKQKITIKPHQVSNVIASTAKLLKRLLPEDIELKLNLGDNGAVALLDVSQIDQVLMNLATNARDAMPHGGSFAIRTEKTMLDGTFRKTHGFGEPGEYVHLSVSDTGLGMDEKTMARIFDPFFTTKAVGKGTGLGLASAYGIVKQHNGYITVASGLGKGSTFDIYLPLAEPEVSNRPASRAEVTGGSETILVIEDDADVRGMVVKILSAQGYHTLEAADGNDAIGIFGERKDAIDLVILDVVMPERNGKEVFDEIARIDPGVKAVFMSGYTGDIVIDKGVQKESVDFLQKPFSGSKLLAKVREVLDR